MAGLLNPTALWALVLVIPVIILYLLKPKPRHIRIPTLMFIRRIEKSRRLTSLFKRIVKDPLLLIQLVMILLLIAAIADPYVTSEEEKKDTVAAVIVLDSSASMKTFDVKTTRFSYAVQLAKKIIDELAEDSQISVVLAENVPVTLLNKGSVDDAKRILSGLECGETPSNIGDAVMLSKDLLAGVNMKRVIYVLSDFAGGVGVDPQVARKIARLNDITISFIQVSGEGSNVGIISLDARRSVRDKNKLYMTFTVRNFGEERDVEYMVLVNDKLVETKSQHINASSDAFFYVNASIPLHDLLFEVRLTTDDQLPVDDKAYAFIPGIKQLNVLLLTSEGGDDGYLVDAIDSINNVRLTKAIPPIIPKFDGFDTIILGDIKKDRVLPGTFRDIRRFVEGGRGLVVVASPELGEIVDLDLLGILPVEVKEKVDSAVETIKIESDHEMLDDVILRDVTVKRYFKTKPREESTTLAGIVDNPIISYVRQGRGTVVFVGVSPKPSWSNFYLRASFPILWSQVLEFVNKNPDSLNTNNLNTGEYLILPHEMDIIMPNGKRVHSQNIFLDMVGAYIVDYGDRIEYVTASLLDEVESNITGVLPEDTTKEDDFRITRTPVPVKKDFLRVMLVLSIIILFTEAYLYRRRGLI